VVLAGCGRVAFDPLGDGGADGDGNLARQANVAFVTSQPVTSADISNGLAGLDSACQRFATAAGRTETFIALASSSNIDAIDRFAGSRGWVRTDGIPLADTVAGMFTQNTMLSPFDVDETGPALPNQFNDVYTGTGIDGRVTENCTDWTGTGNVRGGDPQFGPAPNTASSGFNSSGAYSCTGSPGRLYCMETGKSVDLTGRMAPATSRIIFIANPPAAAGLAGLDAQCTTDAQAVGLPGTYRTVVSTTTATAASRFVQDSRPIYRVDGSQVAVDAAHLFDNSKLMSFVNQMANGTYLPARDLRTGGDPLAVGSVTSTCSDWADVSATSSGRWGRAAVVYKDFAWNTGTYSCWMVSFPSTICLQE
jgi:hypothetical protein